MGSLQIVRSQREAVILLERELMDVAGYYFANEFPHTLAVAYAKLLGCTPTWTGRRRAVSFVAVVVRTHSVAPVPPVPLCGGWGLQGTTKQVAWRGRSHATRTCLAPDVRNATAAR